MSPAEDARDSPRGSLITLRVLVRQVVVLLRCLLPLRPWRVVVVAPAAMAATTASATAAALAFLADLLELPAALGRVAMSVVEDAVGTVVLLLDLAPRGLERRFVL